MPSLRPDLLAAAKPTNGQAVYFFHKQHRCRAQPLQKSGLAKAETLQQGCAAAAWCKSTTDCCSCCCEGSDQQPNGKCTLTGSLLVTTTLPTAAEHVTAQTHSLCLWTCGEHTSQGVCRRRLSPASSVSERLRYPQNRLQNSLLRSAILIYTDALMSSFTMYAQSTTATTMQ